jgi:hypothetical protein
MTLNFDTLLKTKNYAVKELLKDPKEIVKDRTDRVRYFFNNNKTQDCNAASFTAMWNLGLERDIDGDFGGAIIKATIFNGSGAHDSYTWTIKNITKGTTLQTTTNKFIFSETEQWASIFVEPEKNQDGDLIELEITNGVIGTTNGATYNGFVELEIQNFTFSKNGENPTITGSGGHA